MRSNLFWPMVNISKYGQLGDWLMKKNIFTHANKKGEKKLMLK